jgi:hypothetical protein
MTGEPGEAEGDLLSELARFVFDHRPHGTADATRSGYIAEPKLDGQLVHDGRAAVGYSRLKGLTFLRKGFRSAA